MLTVGKSNLMDAISFVFGERTQSLRVRTVKVSVKISRNWSIHLFTLI